MSKGRMLQAIAFVVFISLSAGALAAAHHSLSGAYDTGAQLSLEGILREFHFVNPHPYISVDVTRNGRTQRWKMEMDNRSELVDIGMTSATLKNGDRIMVSGSPGHAGAPVLYIRRLDRPQDGFWYEQVGFEPRMGKSEIVATDNSGRG